METADSSAATSDQLTALRAVISKFLNDSVRPKIRELETEGQFPREIYEQLGDIGAFGCIFSEELGGSKMGFEALATVSEEIAYAYPPLSACMNLQAATVPLTIQNWGTSEQVMKYVPGLITGRLLGSNAMS